MHFKSLCFWFRVLFYVLKRLVICVPYCPDKEFAEERDRTLVYSLLGFPFPFHWVSNHISSKLFYPLFHSNFWCLCVGSTSLYYHFILFGLVFSPPLQCNYFVFARPSSFLVFLCLLKKSQSFKTQLKYQQLLLSFPWSIWTESVAPSVVFMTSLSVILTVLRFTCSESALDTEQRYHFLFTAVFLMLSIQHLW